MVRNSATGRTGLTAQRLVVPAQSSEPRLLPPFFFEDPGKWVMVREKQATFSLAPGQPRRPGTLTPVEGLVLAGDWIDTGLPGTIESAVVSGHRAAATLAGRAALGSDPSRRGR